MCTKAFYTEAALDKHLHARHPGLVPPSADVCLADYCDVLQCDVYAAAATGVATLASHATAAARLPPGARRCDARQLELARHRCESLLRLCLPLHSGSSSAGGGGNATREAARHRAAHERLLGSHCGMLTCDHVDAMFAATALSVRAWRLVRRITTVAVALAVVVYYIGVARDVLATAALPHAQHASGPARQRRGGPPGVLPSRKNDELSRRVATFLMGGKLGVRLAFGQLLWHLAQRLLRRLKRNARKKTA